MSGLPGRVRTCRRNLRPNAHSLLRSVISAEVFSRGRFALILDADSELGRKPVNRGAGMDLSYRLTGTSRLGHHCLHGRSHIVVVLSREPHSRRRG
jgi:hypothetical protein